MRNNNSNKNYKLLQISSNKTHYFPHNLNENLLKNLKLQYNVRNNRYNIDDNKNIKKIKTKNFYEKMKDDFNNSLIHKRINSNNIPRISNVFYHKKLNKSNDIINYITPPFNNYKLNLNNTNNVRNKYKKFKLKSGIYNSSFQNNNISQDNKRKYNSNSYTKYTNQTFFNTSYDFKKTNYQIQNYNGDKSLPVIVVSKKKDIYRTSNDFYKKNKSIIKIQSAFRGYLLRKITIVSLKKYIGFIALIRYLQKIRSNNIEYLFDEFIFLLKKYCKQQKLKYIYKKVNKRSVSKKYRTRNLTQLNENITNDSNDNNELSDIKINLFKSEGFENAKGKTVDNINNSGENLYSNRKRFIINNKKYIDNNSEIKEKKENNSSIIRKKPKNYINYKCYTERNNTIYRKPKKIIYVPKKATGYKKSINKAQIEELINLIRKICYYRHYPVVLYKLKILQKLNFMKFRLKTLYNIVKLIEKNNLKKYLKKYLQKYRDKIITLKVNDEIFKNNNKNINAIYKKIEKDKKNKTIYKHDININNKKDNNNIKNNFIRVNKKKLINKDNYNYSFNKSKIDINNDNIYYKKNKYIFNNIINDNDSKTIIKYINKSLNNNINNNFSNNKFNIIDNEENKNDKYLNNNNNIIYNYKNKCRQIDDIIDDNKNIMNLKFYNDFTNSIIKDDNNNLNDNNIIDIEINNDINDDIKSDMNNIININNDNKNNIIINKNENNINNDNNNNNDAIININNKEKEINKEISKNNDKDIKNINNDKFGVIKESESINKRVELENRIKKSKVYKYFKKWKIFVQLNKKKDENNSNDNILYMSPNNFHRNKSQRKLKIKYSHDLFTKISNNLNKNEEKSNISAKGVSTKKMRIKKNIVDPLEYFRSCSINFNKRKASNNFNDTYNDSNPNLMKLFYLVDKIEIKSIKYRYFTLWKKGKK